MHEAAKYMDTLLGDEKQLVSVLLQPTTGPCNKTLWFKLHTKMCKIVPEAALMLSVPFTAVMESDHWFVLDVEVVFQADDQTLCLHL